MTLGCCVAQSGAGPKLDVFRHQGGNRLPHHQALPGQAALTEIVRQYRALKLPLAMPRPARILRELDRLELLGTDLMLVGSNAFAACEIEAGCRFLGGLDETEDFDLAWCRGARVRPSTPPIA